MPLTERNVTVVEGRSQRGFLESPACFVCDGDVGPDKHLEISFLIPVVGTMHKKLHLGCWVTLRNLVDRRAMEAGG